MLTSEHSIVVFHGTRAVPDRLTRNAHAHYAAYAERMLGVYREGAGKTRRELHRAVEGVFADEPECEVRRIQAFCRLLDDASTFASDPRGEASRLRVRVFEMAATRHPLVARPDRLFDHEEKEVKAWIASEVGRPWEQVEAALYADVIDFQTLASFEGYPSAEALLSRYNVAQLQACLYRAERMAIRAKADLKTILRYAKLARLLHEVERCGPQEFRIELTGPASVLRATRRYGVDLARFVPALLACRDWRMQAQVCAPWGGKALLRLSSEDGLKGHLPPPEEFDSALEEGFAKKFGETREGWRLLREAEVFVEGQTAFLPDFVFVHDDGTEVPFEIVGFWTPEYLDRKRRTLARFRNRLLLLAVPERTLGGRTPSEDVVAYKSSLKIEPVLAALERARAQRHAAT